MSRILPLALAGATVPRGLERFGAHSPIHTTRILRLPQGLPISIETVDRADRIEGFLSCLDAMVGEGLIALETVPVITYRRRGSPATGD